MAVSVLIGLAMAVYENALPFYLRDEEFSGLGMGLTYAVPALAVFVLRQMAGRWSDLVGRKLVYLIALVANGLMTLLTPLAGGVAAQTALKSVREPALQIRNMIHSVLLYEGMPKRFIDLFGKTRGAEFLFQGIGALLAAWSYSLLRGRVRISPERLLLLTSGGLVIASAVVFAALYREKGFKRSSAQGIGLRDFIRPSLDTRLYVLMASIFVFNIGLSCSHCFALQLFFLEKFHASRETVFVISALHRFMMAIPLLFVGWVVRGNYKRLYIIFSVTEGALIAAPAFIGTLWPAAGVWLLHDLFGAGIWLPIQHALLQRYSRPESRGREMGIVLSISYLGMVVGPILAGFLRGSRVADASTRTGLPFLAGGVIVVASAAILLFLREHSSAERR